MAPRLVVFWGEVKRGEDPHLAEKNKNPPGCSPRWKHSGHTQKHHTRIRNTTQGDFEGDIWTTNQRHFQNVGLGMCLVVLGTFIKTGGFGSLTENDATGGAHLFGPTTDLFYGLKHRFLRKCPKSQNVTKFYGQIPYV